MYSLNIALVLTALATAGVASASVDRTPGPGGVYRLKPGIYVQKGVACGSAPNAAVREYDGRGISTPHTRACRARILSKRGDRYTAVSYTHLRAHETSAHLVCRLLLEKKNTF